MKYEKEKLSLEEGLKREWLITNGIGGYSSSTILGANTRKYHGLLVAPLNIPGNRQVILSKLDESIEIKGKKYDLYTNICENYISDGYKKQISFEKEYIPIFTYQIKDTIIKKFICMEHGKNTVSVFYYIKNGENKSKFTMAPIMNYRGFHTINENENVELYQNIEKNKVKLIIDNHSQNPVYIYSSEGKYIRHENDIFRNMYYIEEEKRKLGAKENHIVPGRYEIELNENEEKYITFICSLENNIEELDGRELINKEIVRLSSLIYNTSYLEEKNKKTKNKEYVELVKKCVIASDNFVTYRPSFALYTLIAGYHWFLDWGRDTLISFEGILLKTKRFKEAKEVLLTCIRDMRYGLVPNGYSGYDSRPLYNSVDASLLFFEEIKKFLKYTNEYEWVRENIYPALVKIMNAYQTRIDIDGNNIYMDKDYLISSGTEKIQNTWMDAKIGNEVITPRNGKAVEVNSMWYNALKIMEELTTIMRGKEEAKRYGDLAQKCKESFNKKFYNKEKKSLYDVLGDSKIRPNQLLALSLSYPVINPESREAKEIINTVEKKLLTPYGLKTLAKGEENYCETYEGDMENRDRNYHQGIIWPWLLGLYYDALNNMIKAEKNIITRIELEKKLTEFKTNVKETFAKEINEGESVGSICEIYDIKNEKYRAQGAKFQAWSVAEIMRIIL